MRRLAIALLVAACAACGFKPSKIFESYARIEVQEVRRSLQCRTPSAKTSVQLFDSVDAVREWQAARGIDLIGAERLPAGVYAVVEVGARNTGGYGVAIGRPAVLRGELAILYGTFITPAAADFASQALSSPCVLVQLPPGRYSAVEVQDQSGAVRASGSRAAPPSEPKPEPPSQ
jgi:hypothetical protein